MFYISSKTFFILCLLLEYQSSSPKYLTVYILIFTGKIIDCFLVFVQVRKYQGKCISGNRITKQWDVLCTQFMQSLKINHFRNIVFLPHNNWVIVTSSRSDLAQTILTQNCLLSHRGIECWKRVYQHNTQTHIQTSSTDYINTISETYSTVLQFPLPQ